MFGIVAIFAGVNEFIAMPMSSSGWKWVHGILGVLFIAAGIMAFFRPQGTFVALATIFAWFILFKGIFDVIAALMVRGDLWWLLLTVGILEILLGFWAAGYFRGSAILLVVWIAVFALFRGMERDHGRVQAAQPRQGTTAGGGYLRARRRSARARDAPFRAQVARTSTMGHSGEYLGHASSSSRWTAPGSSPIRSCAAAPRT